MATVHHIEDPNVGGMDKRRLFSTRWYLIVTLAPIPSNSEGVPLISSRDVELVPPILPQHNVTGDQCDGDAPATGFE